MSERAGVTLVLGAGGPVGRAYHAGVLRALADACGWDARAAELILGTSAGAQVAALLRGGVTAADLYARVTGDGWPDALPNGDGAPRWPASPLYLRRLLRRPWLFRPGRLIAAALPEGRADNRPLGTLFDELHGADWPAQPLWIPAVHLDTGAPVIFGRADAPAIDVGTAVRCSSAVPWLRRPVVVAGERYVDGGIASATHALAIAEPGRPTLALVSSPLSRFALQRLLLRAELGALARRGIRAFTFEPDREVAAAIGYNPMDPRRAPRVLELAYRTTLTRLRHRDAAPLTRALSG
jgi:NTE family protein